jgi:hypothetical protein
MSTNLSQQDSMVTWVSYGAWVATESVTWAAVWPAFVVLPGFCSGMKPGISVHHPGTPHPSSPTLSSLISSLSRCPLLRSVPPFTTGGEPTVRIPYLHEVAAECGVSDHTTRSNITCQSFYLRLGYGYISGAALWGRSLSCSAYNSEKLVAMSC